ncbi:MAG: lysostaphin resistance A-like protein [Candidatus Limnocylindrales bacterium]
MTRGAPSPLAMPTLLALVAALVQPVRLPVIVIVIAGFAVLRWRGSQQAAAWAAPIPILATFAWGVTISPLAEAGPFVCDSPLSLPAVARLAEAIGGLALVLALGRLIGIGRAEIGLLRPSRTILALSAGLVLLLGPLAILGFRAVAAPFFGAFDYAFTWPAVLLPALVFALANGALEEVVYRGAMLGWTGRLVGFWPAAIAQAVVFGAAHSGPGFVGSAAPVILAMTLAGLLAAVVVRRTGSLLPTIAIHVALDVPLYLSIACRAS